MTDVLTNIINASCSSHELDSWAQSEAKELPYELNLMSYRCFEPLGHVSRTPGT